MATLNELLLEQSNFIDSARKALDEARNNPAKITSPIALKEATMAELRLRIANLTFAKEAAAKQIQGQIDAYTKEFDSLTQQIKEDKKLPSP